MQVWYKRQSELLSFLKMNWSFCRGGEWIRVGNVWQRWGKIYVYRFFGITECCGRLARSRSVISKNGICMDINIPELELFNVFAIRNAPIPYFLMRSWSALYSQMMMFKEDFTNNKWNCRLPAIPQMHQWLLTELTWEQTMIGATKNEWI